MVSDASTNMPTYGHGLQPFPRSYLFKASTPDDISAFRAILKARWSSLDAREYSHARLCFLSFFSFKKSLSMSLYSVSIILSRIFMVARGNAYILFHYTHFTRILFIYDIYVAFRYYGTLFSQRYHLLLPCRRTFITHAAVALFWYYFARLYQYCIWLELYR